MPVGKRSKGSDHISVFDRITFASVLIIVQSEAKNARYCFCFLSASPTEIEYQS